MAQNLSLRSGVFGGALLLSLALLIHPAGGQDHMNGADGKQIISDGHSGNHSGVAVHKPDYPPTYFALLDHRVLIYAHVTLMILAWVFALPVGEWCSRNAALCPSSLTVYTSLAVMLSIAQSRFTLVLQLAFLGVNMLGVILATVYNAKTPDLYPNNAHHTIGWVATWVMVAQVTVGLVGRIAGAFNERYSRDSGERQAFIPASSNDHWHGIANDYADPDTHRMSNDSGQGTEPKTESLRGNSISSSDGGESQEVNKEFDDRNDGSSDAVLTLLPRGGMLAPKAVIFASTRAWSYVNISYRVIDRIILPLGFIALTTGIVTFGRFFVSRIPPNDKHHRREINLS